MDKHEKKINYNYKNISRKRIMNIIRLILLVKEIIEVILNDITQGCFFSTTK
jgi:hypothetical protein